MTTGKRGRPAIKPHIKALIYDKALNTTTPRQALAVELKHLITEMGEIPPSEETIMRHISSARNNRKSPLDEPWNLSTLRDNPIVAEAIPAVLKVWIYHQGELMDSTSDGSGDVPLFTIREARWAERLYKVLEDIPTLALWTFIYAKIERICEVLDIKKLSTAIFDVIILEESTNQGIEPKLYNSIFKRLSEHDQAFKSQAMVLLLLCSQYFEGKLTEKELDSLVSAPDKLLLYLQHLK